MLTRCSNDATKLAKLLSKDELKGMCAERNLRVSGTKSELAPRLLQFRLCLALLPVDPLEELVLHFAQVRKLCACGGIGGM